MRLIHGSIGICPVRAVETLAYLATSQCADKDPGTRCRELARARAELRAEQTAQRGATKRSERLLLTISILFSAPSDNCSQCRKDN